eukprot:Skav218677  [mRNA]  locus=scaffold44:202182:202545:- [translate_table: standard]
MAKAFGILLLIPVLAEKACHEGSCDDSALMQMNRRSLTEMGFHGGSLSLSNYYDRGTRTRVSLRRCRTTSSA